MKSLLIGKKINVTRDSWKPFKILCYAPLKPKCSFQRNINVCFQNKSPG